MHNPACPLRAQTILSEGWFRPGDTAQWTPGGTPDILGRVNDDLISTGSQKLSARLIEAVLLSQDGIVEAATFPSPKSGSEEIIAFAVFAYGINRGQVVEKARRDCAMSLGKEFAPARAWPINALPRRENGAPDRERCVAMVKEAIDAGKVARDAT